MIDKQTKPQKPNKTKAKKIYNIVSGIVVACVFIFLIFVVALVVIQKSSGKDTSVFGFYMFDVLTESMEPTICAGDVILAKKVDLSLLKNDDIITFIAPSGNLKGFNVTHRITSISRNADGSIEFITTKGDNPSILGNDNWKLSPNAVKAVYVKSLPVVASIRTFLTKPIGYVVLIVFPLLIVAVLIIFGIVNDRAKIEKEKLEKDKKNNPLKLDDLSEDERNKLLSDYLAEKQAETTEDKQAVATDEKQAETTEDKQAETTEDKQAETTEDKQAEATDENLAETITEKQAETTSDEDKKADENGEKVKKNDEKSSGFADKNPRKDAIKRKKNS